MLPRLRQFHLVFIIKTGRVVVASQETRDPSALSLQPIGVEGGDGGGVPDPIRC